MECKQFSFCMCYAQTENREKYGVNEEGKQREKSTFIQPIFIQHVAVCTNARSVAIPIWRYAMILMDVQVSLSLYIE